LDIDPIRLKKTIEENIKGSAAGHANIVNIPLTKQAEKVLKITYLEEREGGIFRKAEARG